MTNIFAFVISIILSIHPSSTFSCDEETLVATVRNNLNGDFALVNDLEKLDKGAFVVLDWKNLNLMLPISFQEGEISFTDKKWLWSYQDNEIGLHIDHPRFSQMLPNGETFEHKCKSPQSIESSSN